MKKGYWKPRNGKIIKIKDMKSEHIYNCMRFLYGAGCLDYFYNKTLTKKEFKMHDDYMWNKYYEMKNEYLRRTNEN